MYFNKIIRIYPSHVCYKNLKNITGLTLIELLLEFAGVNVPLSYLRDLFGSQSGYYLLTDMLLLLIDLSMLSACMWVGVGVGVGCVGLIVFIESLKTTIYAGEDDSCVDIKVLSLIFNQQFFISGEF
uniref:Uncharacterized protein n=1 Tax=Glossina brevipalpis TaxID=37001 RepID=A0A1A9W8W3_9MUSC